VDHSRRRALLSARGPLLAAFAYPAATADPLTLSEAGTRWVAAHPLVRYSVAVQAHPYCFLEGARPSGIVVDMLGLIAQQAGLSLQYVPKRTPEQALDALAAGEVSVVPYLRMNVEQAAEFRFTRPVARVTLGIFSRFDSPYIDGLDDLGGRRVGVPAGTHGTFSQAKPAVRFVEFSPVDRLVHALWNKEVDAIVGPVPSVLFEVKRQRAMDLVTLQTVLGTKVPFAMACARSAAPLVEILDHGLDRILSHERREIAEHYAQRDRGSAFRLSSVEALLAVSAMVTGIAAVWARRAGLFRRD